MCRGTPAVAQKASQSQNIVLIVGGELVVDVH